MKQHALTLMAALVAILAPIQAAIIAVFVLVCADLVFGVLCARKRGNAVLSSGLRRTISKLFVYEMALILGFIAEKYLIGGAMPISRIIAGFIGLTEIKSVIENLNELSGQSIFQSLIGKLGAKPTDE